jgi:hypothetical protein
MPLLRRNDYFNTPRMLPVLRGDQDDNDADGLTPSRLGPHPCKLAAVLIGNALADRITIGRGGRRARHDKHRKQDRTSAKKRKTASHFALLAHGG